MYDTKASQALTYLESINFRREAALSLLMATTSYPHKLIVSSFKISIYKDETKWKKSSLLSTNSNTKMLFRKLKSIIAAI